jgi:hypothetical protein
MELNHIYISSLCNWTIFDLPGKTQNPLLRPHLISRGEHRTPAGIWKGEAQHLLKSLKGRHITK